MDKSTRFGFVSSDNCPIKTRFRYDSDRSGYELKKNFNLQN